ILQSLACYESPNPFHKFRKISSKFLLWYRHLWPGRDVYHPVTIAQVVQDMRHLLILRTREYIYMNSHFPKLTGQIAHVHIHTTRVFSTQDSQRTSMIRYHGYAQFAPPHTLALQFQPNPCIMCPALQSDATVAQLAEQAFRKRQVKGSNPFGGSYSVLRCI